MLVDDKLYFRTGKGTAFSGGLGYTWSPSWYSEINVSSQRNNRNFEQGTNADFTQFFLVEEWFNSNGVVKTVSVSTTYKQGGLSLTPSFEYSLRNANDWGARAFGHVPRKDIFKAGLKARYALTSSIDLTAAAEHGWLHEHSNPDKPCLSGGTPRLLGAASGCACQPGLACNRPRHAGRNAARRFAVFKVKPKAPQ